MTDFKPILRPFVVWRAVEDRRRRSSPTLT